MEIGKRETYYRKPSDNGETIDRRESYHFRQIYAGMRTKWTEKKENGEPRRKNNKYDNSEVKGRG